MPEIPASLAEFATARAARPRHGDPHRARCSTRWTRARSTLSTGERVPTRLLCWTAGVTPPPVVARARACRSARAAASRSTRRCAWRAATNVWAIGDAAAVPDPAKHRRSADARRPASTRSARDGEWPRTSPRRSAAAAAAVPLPHARRVRRHGPAQGGRDDARACACAASRPGSRRGPTTCAMMPGWRARCGWRSTGRSAWSSAAPPPSSGQLGHPAALEHDRTRRSRRARAVSVALVPRGHAPRDLRATFELGEAALDASRKERGLLPADASARPRTIWTRAGSASAALLEFIVAQADGCYLICEDGDEMVGYARVARFGAMDELTELWVAPSHSGRGVGRALLERCWPEAPTPDLGRVVAGTGAPADLTPLHRVRRDAGERATGTCATAAERLPRAPLAGDRRHASPAVHVLTPERAVAEWKRLEPLAIGHERPLLHEFFGRTRTCLATIDPGEGEATALCWVARDGDIGPAVGEEPEDLVPVVLAALDRVAKTQEPESLGVFCTTDSLVAAGPPAAARLPRPLAELGDVLGAAARASTAICPRARPGCSEGALPELTPWVKSPRTPVASCSPSRCCWSRPSSSSRSCSASSRRSPGSWSSCVAVVAVVWAVGVLR